jgi:hypothetical protein
MREGMKVAVWAIGPPYIGPGGVEAFNVRCGTLLRVAIRDATHQRT